MLCQVIQGTWINVDCPAERPCDKRGDFGENRLRGEAGRRSRYTVVGQHVTRLNLKPSSNKRCLLLLVIAGVSPLRQRRSRLPPLHPVLGSKKDGELKSPYPDFALLGAALNARSQLQWGTQGRRMRRGRGEREEADAARL